MNQALNKNTLPGHEYAYSTALGWRLGPQLLARRTHVGDFPAQG